MSTLLYGKVAKVNGSPAVSIVVNKGSADGVTRQATFVIMKDDTGDLIDPNAPGANLGRPKLLTGTGSVLILQEHMTLVTGTFSQMATVATTQDVEITIP